MIIYGDNLKMREKGAGVLSFAAFCVFLWERIHDCKSNTYQNMKTKSLLLAFVCTILCAFNAVAAEGYAVLSYDTLTYTLTFYYGTKPAGAFSLNTGDNYPAWFNNGKPPRVQKVVFDPSFAQARPTSTAHWFDGFTALGTIIGLNYLNTSEVTNMQYMFRNCPWQSTLDLSTFNTSKVTDMTQMFRDCIRLTNINLNSFNTSNVTNMSGMFYDCRVLTTLDVSKFNTSKVTDMSGMFSYCRKLTSLDLSSFNTSKVTDMGSMFSDCSELKNVNLSSFNTSNVTKMSGMFYGCSSLNQLHLDNFNTSNVTDMRWMFYECKKLTSVDVSSFNTSKVTDMSAMFNGCSELKNVNLSSFNTSKVKGMGAMFAKCRNLKTVKVSDAWSTAAVEDSYDMFYMCTSIVGGAGTTFDEEYTDAAYAHIDGGPSNPGYFTSSSGGTLGDVNGDGKVNVSDVTTLVNMILGVIPKDEARADINGDGKINVSDVTTLINIILGIS